MKMAGLQLIVFFRQQLFDLLVFGVSYVNAPPCLLFVCEHVALLSKSIGQVKPSFF